MAELVYKTTLFGRPITKKNHQEIRSIKAKDGGRRPSIGQSKKYIQYESDCIWQMRKPRKPIEGRLWVVCRYWMPTAAEPDLTNLLAASHDILEKAGVIKNDKLIKSVDKSRVKGKDAKNPRVEIEIYLMGEDDE